MVACAARDLSISAPLDDPTSVVLIVSPFLVALCSLRKIGLLQRTSQLGLMALLFSVGVTIYDASLGGIFQKPVEIDMVNVATYPQFMGNAAFLYLIHSVVLPLEQEQSAGMKQHQRASPVPSSEWKKAVRWSMALVTFINIAFSVWQVKCCTTYVALSWTELSNGRANGSIHSVGCRMRVLFEGGFSVVCVCVRVHACYCFQDLFHDRQGQNRGQRYRKHLAGAYQNHRQATACSRPHLHVCALYVSNVQADRVRAMARSRGATCKVELLVQAPCATFRHGRC